VVVEVQLWEKSFDLGPTWCLVVIDLESSLRVGRWVQPEM
jgi:hypothetical protein